MELKKCPFCAEDAKIKEHKNWPDPPRNLQVYFTVGCDTDGCVCEVDSDGTPFNSLDSAMAAWNMRGIEIRHNPDQSVFHPPEEKTLSVYQRILKFIKGVFMKAGDTVEIYEDPVTCKKLEGKAVLIRPIGPPDRGLQIWHVRFEGEKGVYTRVIKEK